MKYVSELGLRFAWIKNDITTNSLEFVINNCILLDEFKIHECKKRTFELAWKPKLKTGEKLI